MTTGKIAQQTPPTPTHHLPSLLLSPRIIGPGCAMPLRATPLRHLTPWPALPAMSTPSSVLVLPATPIRHLASLLPYRTILRQKCVRLSPSTGWPSLDKKALGTRPQLGTPVQNTTLAFSEQRALGHVGSKALDDLLAVLLVDLDPDRPPALQHGRDQRRTAPGEGVQDNLVERR